MGTCVSKGKKERRSDSVSSPEAIPDRPTSANRDRGFRAQLVKHMSIGNIWDLYEVGDMLGSGMSGAVHVVRRKETGDTFAMKTVNMNRILPEALEDLRSEIQLLKEIDHPNVIKLYETYEDKRHMYLIMELCTGGELYDRLVSQKYKRYTEKDAANLVLQMCKAVAYIHGKNICHRDLKLENFVFESEGKAAALKLIDFGLSRKYVQGLHMKSMVGTVYYIAPEVLKEQGYGLACDIWAIGVITYILLCGKPPFNGRENITILHKIAHGRFTFHHPVWKRVSDEAKDFIKFLLVPNPKRRPTIQEVLKHPWLAEGARAPAVPLDEHIVESLHSFSKEKHLKRAALEAIAFSLNPQQIAELRDAFFAIDTDHSGTISMEELEKALIKRGVPTDKVEAIFSTVDQDRTGVISYSEFLAASIRQRQFLTEERLMEAFERLDTDGSGYITAENLREVMGDDYDAARVEAMISEADIMGDGRISFDEFLKLMRDDVSHVRQELETAVAQAGVEMMERVIQRDIADNPEVKLADQAVTTPFTTPRGPRSGSVGGATEEHKGD